MTVSFGDMIRARYSVTAHNETLGGISMQYQRGEFDLEAPYQRGHVWGLQQKQLLIDSLLSGLGIPPIFVIHHDDARDAWREVVDGKQRLTALMGFLQSEFPVCGVFYRDLDTPSQRKIRNTGISIYIVHDATSEMAWEIFRRVNFCGVPQDEAAYIERRANQPTPPKDQEG